jgi:trans-aconitate 2-methyltransferase
MREWNAETYHRVSEPHVQWGMRVLDRLPLAGDELVLDVGCGTGRLTEKLLERLPNGRALAVDQSVNMLDTARRYLTPRFRAQIHFVLADATALPVAGRAHALFSTATFHWVLDHPALFRSIHAALRPGGRLVAQCGGGPNLERLHARCDRLLHDRAFAAYFAEWREPWNFADAETTARRLSDADFVDIVTSVEPSPVIQPDAAAYREFVANVICRPFLARLPDEKLRDRFMDALTTKAAGDMPAFELDYWRLNMEARRPR